MYFIYAACFNLSIDDQIAEIINCSAWLWHSVRSKHVCINTKTLL